MRTIRILACLGAVFALGAITAASASASPEFDAAVYPTTGVEQKATQLNIQGFNGGGVVIACRKFTANTNEEIGKVGTGKEATNPKKNSPTLIVHPKYTECRGTLAAGSFPVEVKTEGCNYRVHAATPGKSEGSVDVVCAAGKGIENVFIALTGCTVTVKEQLGLKKIDFINAPKTGTETQEVTTTSEVANIKSKATSACGLVIGEAEFTAEYREGEIETVAGVETAKIAPAGKPAKSASQAFNTATSAQEAGEVGINEPHWYENHVPIAKQTGKSGEEGTDLIAWGKLTLTTVTLGVIECENEFGGDVYNAEGSGPPPGGGMAKAGEFKVDAFQAYDCTGTECETTLKSKQFIESEGLGVVVNGTTKEAEFQEWEGGLQPPVSGVTRLKVGNKTVGSTTQVKLHITCPKTTGAEQNSKSKGELTPEVENGTAEGSAPSKFNFGAGSGELEIGATPEGKVTGKLKAMGFEGGALITTAQP